MPTIPFLIQVPLTNASACLNIAGVSTTTIRGASQYLTLSGNILTATGDAAVAAVFNQTNVNYKYLFVKTGAGWLQLFGDPATNLLTTQSGGSAVEFDGSLMTVGGTPVQLAGGIPYYSPTVTPMAATTNASGGAIFRGVGADCSFEIPDIDTQENIIQRGQFGGYETLVCGLTGTHINIFSDAVFSEGCNGIFNGGRGSRGTNQYSSAITATCPASCASKYVCSNQALFANTNKKALPPAGTSSSSSGGLGIGAIMGIVAAVVIVAVIIGILIWRRKRWDNKEDASQISSRKNPIGDSPRDKSPTENNIVKVFVHETRKAQEEVKDLGKKTIPGGLKTKNYDPDDEDNEFVDKSSRKSSDEPKAKTTEEDKEEQEYIKNIQLRTDDMQRQLKLKAEEKTNAGFVPEVPSNRI